MLNKEELLKISKETNIKNKGFLEKLYYQDILLYDLSRSNLDFVFKGGTAIYHCYLDQIRFSKDLDFTSKTKLKLSDVENLFSGFEI